MSKLKTAGRRAAESMSGGDVTLEEFMGLSAPQIWLIDLKIDLGGTIREQRAERGWTQTQLARALEISQPRVANLEAGGPSVTVDVQLLALRILGITPESLNEALCENFAENQNLELLAV